MSVRLGPGSGFVVVPRRGARSVIRGRRAGTCLTLAGATCASPARCETSRSMYAPDIRRGSRPPGSPRASGRRRAVTDIEHLRDPAEIEGFARDARTEGRLALDTEFVWERTYSPVPCLLQLATAHRIGVIDPLENVD